MSVYALSTGYQPSSPQPLHVIIDSPGHPLLQSLPILISGIALVVSITTFVLAYMKRVRERKATWYHKVVVDDALPKIFKLFELADTIFAGVPADVATQQKTIPRRYTIAMADFSGHLIKTQNSIYERIVVFDPQRAAGLVQVCEDLQDKMAEWFENIFVYRRTNAGDLRSILLEGQRAMINLLYEFEFKHF